MQLDEAATVLTRLMDGQELNITLASGNTYTGIYDSTKTSLEDGLYWEDLQGRAFRADWDKVADVGFRRAATVVSERFVVPPEHPLSGEALGRLKPYTTRNS